MTSIRKTALVLEFDKARRGRPWRHFAAFNQRQNLFGVPCHVLVIKKAEWAGLAGAMAAGAVLINNGGYLLIEGEGLRSLDGWKAECQNKNETFAKHAYSNCMGELAYEE